MKFWGEIGGCLHSHKVSPQIYLITKGTIATLQWRNPADTILMKWAKVTSPVIKRIKSTRAPCYDALRKTQHHSSGVFAKNA